MMALYLLFLSANLLYPLPVMSLTINVSAMEIIPDFRYEIANELQELTREIQYEAKRINPTVLLELKKIVSQLDPRYVLSTDNLQGNPIPDKCEEVLKGIQPELHSLVGFAQLPPCKKEDKQPIHKLITILLLDREQNIKKISYILHTIRSYNPDIKIILGSSASDKEAQNINAKYKEVDTVPCNHIDLQCPGKILNLMVMKIETPYVLVARDIFYFNDLAQLERQVFVISSTNVVGIAGGAFRNETGYWKVGCHLSQIKNCFLQYTEGYKYSALGCMLCDHLEGPFVARTSIMRDTPFMNNLYEEVLFEDWFLRVKQKNILTMSCPDVMYFKKGLLEGVANEVKLREHSSWLGLAKEWQVDHVLFPFRVSMKFTCKELTFSCESYSWSQSHLFLTCCMEQVNKALKALNTFRAKNGVDYEIIFGTLLGAVKLRNFLPWDKDIDIAISKDDYSKFLADTDFFSKNGYDTSEFAKYHVIYVPEIKLNFFLPTQSSTFRLPKQMWKYPTQIKCNGIWVRAVWNPGWWVRKKYGPDFLKHTQMKWYKYMVVLNPPGFWNSCPNKSHHSCLDHYPSDGSEGLLPKLSPGLT